MSLFIMSPCYSETSEPADKMMATARRVGIEPYLYGIGARIEANCSNAQGTDMIALMETRTEDYIMCVDAFDVAFLAGEAEIMEKFLSFNSGLVMSAERSGIAGLHNTRVKLHQMCIAAGGYHAQLNMGCWIGKREYALHCFKEAERIWRPQPEDSYNYDVLPQWLMQMKARIGVGGVEVTDGDVGPDFELDWKDVLFQSMDQPDFTMEGKRLKNNVTGTYPVLAHYNGDKSRVAFNLMVEYLLA